MTQQIIRDFPPLYKEIATTFNLRIDDPVIFSWGDRVYSPHDEKLHPALVVHEAVHGERQGKDREILLWWERYMRDPMFRLREEIPAHQAEYRWFLENSSRRGRRRALKQIAKRLASPLYGNVVRRRQAEAILRAGAEAAKPEITFMAMDEAESVESICYEREPEA